MTTGMALSAVSAATTMPQPWFSNARPVSSRTTPTMAMTTMSATSFVDATSLPAPAALYQLRPRHLPILPREPLPPAQLALLVWTMMTAMTAANNGLLLLRQLQSEALRQAPQQAERPPASTLTMAKTVAINCLTLQGLRPRASQPPRTTWAHLPQPLPLPRQHA